MSVVAVAVVGAAVIGAVVTTNQAKKNRELTEDLSDAALAQQQKEMAKLDAQKELYKKVEFKNHYKNIENFYEDLTVNKQQAEFQSQQGSQQRANVMNAFKESAGGSGIAGLAQAMANQGALQTQQISASIGRQEAANQKLMAKGAAAADMAERGGEAHLQQAEMDRQATLLGIAMGGAAGANQALQGAYSNQMAASVAETQATSDAVSNITSATVQGISAHNKIKDDKLLETGVDSDRKLKKNINKIGESPSGLNIYSFEYKNPSRGEGLFQGVMSDEVPQEAVGTRGGYDTVDYGMIDVEFKQI